MWEGWRDVGGGGGVKECSGKARCVGVVKVCGKGTQGLGNRWEG